MNSSTQTLLDELLQDRSLRNPDQLRRRIDALEQLESWLFNRSETLAPSHRQCGEALTAELEAINSRLYQDIRNAIRQGGGADSLRAWRACLRDDTAGEKYGPLDTLIAGVLDFQAPAEVPEPGDEMVFYQPTPAQAIFDFIERASITPPDVVMDLGAGLGHVTLLTAICTGALHRYRTAAGLCGRRSSMRRCVTGRPGGIHCAGRAAGRFVGRHGVLPVYALHRRHPAQGIGPLEA